MKESKTHINLVVKNLSIGYKGKNGNSVIAHSINFSLTKGELIGLVGANGIGKSTLLRTITGMQPGLQGEIFLFGKKLKSYSAFQLAAYISVVLTEPPASKNLTVQEMISLGRQPHTNWMGLLTEKDKKAIDYALSVTETGNLANRKCYELSDGQMQRVAIARAIAQDTPIIILDEPTTHLDLYHRAYILKLLKKLAKEEQKTILFSTHEIDLAIQLTNRMLIMTKEETFFDTPCKLIENENFVDLFPSETIHFDPETGRFLIK